MYVRPHTDSYSEVALCCKMIKCLVTTSNKSQSEVKTIDRTVSYTKIFMEPSAFCSIYIPPLIYWGYWKKIILITCYGFCSHQIYNRLNTQAPHIWYTVHLQKQQNVKWVSFLCKNTGKPSYRRPQSTDNLSQGALRLLLKRIGGP